jgi:hypothetical protein
VLHFRSCIALLFIANLAHAEPTVTEVSVDPPTVELRGAEARQTILIHGKRTDGTLVDLTHSASFKTDDASIMSVNDTTIRPLKDGSTKIVVQVSGKTLNVPVRVREMSKAKVYHFENDIIPLFSRFGCNTSGCHGKAEGQNGFKLSVFGSDVDADYASLVKEARGRRLFAAAPERSILLMKAAGQLPHGGGIRIPTTSDAYETIRGWIANGAPKGNSKAPIVARVRIEPTERTLALNAGQQLRVTAHYTDGRELDVTHIARFQSNSDDIAKVSANGYVQTTDVPGEATIMAAFMNETAVFRALVPRVGKIEFPKLPENNFIDPLVDAKLCKLNIVPSGGIDDATFMRRAYLDVIGMLPTAAEVRKYLADSAPDKRAKLIETLLERTEYAEYWALKWADLLRVERAALGHQGAYAYYRWIRDSVAKNVPLDRFVRELVTAEGPLEDSPAGYFYKAITKPGDVANTFTQVFLGVRITCAECHHHPSDRWAQSDYYGMIAFFTPMRMQKLGNGDALTTQGDSTSKHLRTGETVFAAALGQKATAGKGDVRTELADWMTSPKNPFFARNAVNRLWAHFMGRGLVDPVDDVRATNPPSNVELLDALAAKFIELKYDTKAMIRIIAASRVYQTSTKTNETNERDQQNYSRFYFKRPEAEVLLDMVSDVTGVPEKFLGMPAGTRAIQLWDSKVRHDFLKQFGRPMRVTACECERVGEPTTAQILHLMNGDTINHKLRHEDGHIARWCRQYKDDMQLLDEIYLTFASRLPTDNERKFVKEYLTKMNNRREAFEDVAWALLNTKEFMFNH